MKTYITGPMSGLPEFNYPLFNETAKALRASGHEVVNPTELSGEAKDGEDHWRFCMKNSIIALLDCDSIVALPDWWKSKGALLELIIARAFRMRFYILVQYGEQVKLEQSNWPIAKVIAQLAVRYFGSR